jgi:VIT1/CCC1 family predicted Fe2+/Mn2+ transporter
MTENSSQAGPGKARSAEQKTGSESLTRLVAPIFAAFSLPAIVSFAPIEYPRHALILSLLISATSLFMASIQLSIGPIYDKHPKIGFFRSSLTFLGIMLIAVSLVFLVDPRGWLWLPSVILLIGAFGPATWIIWSWARGRRNHSIKGS